MRPQLLVTSLPGPTNPPPRARRPGPPSPRAASPQGLQFPVRLENTHVISQAQVWAGVLPKGPAGRRLTSAYGARDSADYKEELGNTVVNFARVVPDGLLVIFPSYHVMSACVESWQQAGSPSIWERLLRLKHIVVEPRDSASFPAAKEDYLQKLEGAGPPSIRTGARPPPRPRRPRRSRPRSPTRAARPH